MVFLAGGLGLRDEQTEGAEVDGKEMKLTEKSLDVEFFFFIIRLHFLGLHFQTGFCNPELIIFGGLIFN